MTTNQIALDSSYITTISSTVYVDAVNNTIKSYVDNNIIYPDYSINLYNLELITKCYFSSYESAINMMMLLDKLKIDQDVISSYEYTDKSVETAIVNNTIVHDYLKKIMKLI